jgi:hypothetical protein
VQDGGDHAAVVPDERVFFLLKGGRFFLKVEESFLFLKVCKMEETMPLWCQLKQFFTHEATGK